MNAEQGEAAPSVSVVIPVYRSAWTLEPLVDGIRDVLAGQGKRFEIVLVDDASPDAETGRVLTTLARLPEVRVLRLRRNRGQHIATVVGLSACRGEFTVTMDDDLQHDPSQLPRLLRALTGSDELDAVIARFPDSRHPLHQRIGSHIVNSIVRWTLALPKGFAFTSFIAMRKAVRAQVVAAARGTAHPNIGLLLAEVTNRLANLDVKHMPRRAGKTAWSSGSRTAVAFRLVQEMLISERQSRLVSGASILSGTAALALLGFYMVRFFTTAMPPSGFTTTVVLILGTFSILSLVLSALTRAIAELRVSTWRTIEMEIRSDSSDG